jgi:hypothetical protein
MVSRKFAIVAAVAAAGLAFAPAAMADVELVSFTYSDLEGDFVAGGATSGAFSANDQSVTQGDVTKLVPTLGSAALDFSDAGIGTAFFTLNIAVTNITNTTADGTGTISFQDIDNTQFDATVSGTWVNVGGSANFVGLISDATFAASTGSVFEGTDGNSFSIDLGTGGVGGFLPPFIGNIISLTFGDWFTTGGGVAVSFSDATTLTSGAIAIPAPAAALLGMIGLAAVGRIRRKFA